MKQDILLCDLDAFFASVEQLDNPELQGAPLLIGGDPKGRGVVSTCSYEARKFGVRSAMPMRKAVELCPHATVLPPNMNRYKEVSRQVLEVFQDFTPDILPVSIDEAYLGVNPGSGYKIAEEIRSRIRKDLALPISIGVSVNMLLAKIACEMAKPDNLKAIWPEDVQELLWPLPVEKLPGVGPAAKEKLNKIGIKTIEDLAHFPEEKLVKLLGNNATTLKKYAQGYDNRQIVDSGERKSISKERTFSQDITNRDQIINTLLELSEEVGYRLRSQGLQARTISIKIRYADFTTITRDKTLQEATALDSVIFNSARELFVKYGGRPPWRLVGVKLAGLENWKQLSLLTPEPEIDKEKKVTRIKDELRDKYGRGVLYTAKRLKKK